VRYHVPGPWAQGDGSVPGVALLGNHLEGPSRWFSKAYRISDKSYKHAVIQHPVVQYPVLPQWDARLVPLSSGNEVNTADGDFPFRR
jgi:hypothetical protein